MFSTLSRTLLGLTKYHSTAKVINLTASKSVPNKFKYLKKFFIPVSCSALCLYYINSKNKQTTSATDSQVQKFQTRRDNMKLQTITQDKRSIFLTIWSIFCHTLRFFQLLAIFSPVVFLYPLRFFDRTRGYWLDMFVKSVQRAGVVWIKAFQYMSHRRDIIGPEMADKFVHLRQSAPQHSFQETKKNFEKLYGKKINEVFEEFDEKPIASGSVGQVYRAKYKGNKVAVKVRHPGVQRHIQRDVNLMFFFSRFLSLFSKSFSLPVSQVSMKKTLMDQINFKNQKDNLLIFNQMFKGNKSIKFPLPFIENSNEAFLVETFVEGVPITYYETNRHPLNAVTARLGATTFFEMLMKNNFIHADCHGGNILVDIQQKKNLTFFSQVWEYIKEKCMQLQSYMIESTLKSEVLGKLYQQSKQQEECRRKTIKSSKQKVVVNLIDVGMVIRLEESDRLNFINFIKCVLHGDGEKCAEMIYNLSIFDGKKIIEGKFDSYMAELKSLFSSLKNTSLDDLQGVQLLVGMLNIIRENNMKLEGQFATLLTNMLVLEAVAKNLHEDINILKCAVPYFKYAQKNESDMFDFSDRELV